MAFPDFKVEAVPHVLRNWCAMVTGAERTAIALDLTLAAELVERLIAESNTLQEEARYRPGLTQRITALEEQVAALTERLGGENKGHSAHHRLDLQLDMIRQLAERAGMPYITPRH